jgi:hypothetical protein
MESNEGGKRWRFYFLSLYHSIVFFNPSLREVMALKPNSFSARYLYLISSWVVHQAILKVKVQVEVHKLQETLTCHQISSGNHQRKKGDGSIFYFCMRPWGRS